EEHAELGALHQTALRDEVEVVRLTRGEDAVHEGGERRLPGVLLEVLVVARVALSSVGHVDDEVPDPALHVEWRPELPILRSVREHDGLALRPVAIEELRRPRLLATLHFTRGAVGSAGLRETRVELGSAPVEKERVHGVERRRYADLLD